MIRYYAVLVLMTMIGSLGSLLLKQATQAEGYMKMLLNVNFYFGGGLYFLSALLNIYVLKYLHYSVVLPLTAITYVWTMILSAWVLKEKITYKKVLGVILILAGAVCVSAI